MAYFFEVQGDGIDWDIFAVRRSYGVVGLMHSVKDKILQQIPNFNPSQGNIYDIQYQWRGVGNYYFYVNLKLIYVNEILGTLNKLSVSDPALQSFFSCYCGQQGTEIILKAGCIDISSEGGNNSRTAFSNVNTGENLVTLGAAHSDTAILAIKIPRNINSYYNSRGAVIDKISTWTRDESLTRIFVIRDTQSPNLNGISWSPVYDSHLQIATGGVSAQLDTAFQLDKSNAHMIISEWADIETKNTIVNDSKNSPLEGTPGDIIIVTVRSIGANNVKSSASVYLSDQI